ncbi:MAG: dihydroorotase [Sedimenticola sp.]|nr:dihydroorotase [Sedimenticola sp.]
MKQNRPQNRTRPQSEGALAKDAATRLSSNRLEAENRCFQGTGGVSEGNSGLGFIPAFHDCRSGRNVISRYADGTPSPVHMMDGLPAEWIDEYDESGHALAAREGVIAGFLRNGLFYTREEAARAA